MPIYEYACPDCGGEFERLQKMSEPPITVCPTCSAVNVRKLISRTSFVLKGGGWYKDHYGLKGGKSGEPSSGEGKAPGSGAGDAKAGESKAGESAAAAAPAKAAPASSSGGEGKAASTPAKGAPASSSSGGAS